MKTTPQLSGVAEDWMLLGGAVLYGFFGVPDAWDIVTPVWEETASSTFRVHIPRRSQ